ncbi:MAG: AI-2E family transporter, partial [Gammaproteobacteria bacterium]
MLDVFKNWYHRNFSDPQAVILAVLLILGLLIVIFMGGMLAPILTAIVLAYMLEAVVGLLERYNVPRLLSVIFVFILFLLTVLLLFLLLVPVLSQQFTQLIQELPRQLDKGQQVLLRLPEMYPQAFSETQVNEIISEVRKQITNFGQAFLSFSLASIPVLFALVIYLILVPLLMFFFLKDKDLIVNWVKKFLPKERGLAAQVWQEMDQQIGNYVRGKFVEIFIVGAVTYVTFLVLGLNYALLLAVLVGISVIIPYIGAAAVTIPVALIAYFQWGWGPDFIWVIVAYGVIQALDGNLLVPVLFSEAVNLHPVAIIVAVLVFGGLWGLWGVFFAIP